MDALPLPRVLVQLNRVFDPLREGSLHVGVQFLQQALRILVGGSVVLGQLAFDELPRLCFKLALGFQDF